MNATLLYRITAVLLLLFAIGHTAGFVIFKPATPEGMAVFNSMDQVHFPIGSASYTMGQFYRGFGFFATAYLLFGAYLAWHLGALARTNPPAIGALKWVFFVLQLASIVLSWIYFLPPPVVFSVLTAISTGWAALRLRKAP
jgi:hypothetical protein